MLGLRIKHRGMGIVLTRPGLFNMLVLDQVRGALQASKGAGCTSLQKQGLGGCQTVFLGSLNPNPKTQHRFCWGLGRLRGRGLLFILPALTRPILHSHSPSLKRTQKYDRCSTWTTLAAMPCPPQTPPPTLRTLSDTQVQVLQHLDDSGCDAVAGLLAGLPLESVLVVGQANGFLSQSFDAVDVVVKKDGRSSVDVSA